MNMKREDVDNHFSFGENWLDYSRHLSDEVIKNDENSFNKLIKPEEIRNKTFLDIGSGSGLHSLVALRQGAKDVLSIDIDPVSVHTTRQVLSRYCSDKNWKCEAVSVFDLSTDKYGYYDIVYSWGVLHHTGNLYRAIDAALNMVSPKGMCALALYRKTRMCRLWKVEKKFYSRSSKLVQGIIRELYIGLFRVGYTIIKRKSYKEFIRQYSRNRGMNYYNDVHDWLGGYPYESISPDDLRNFVENRGFKSMREFLVPASIGLLGSGNDEFVFKRV